MVNFGKVFLVGAGPGDPDLLTIKAAKAIALFKSWLEDESGYDEETWPKLKKALNQERDRVGARRLFND